MPRSLPVLAAVTVLATAAPLAAPAAANADEPATPVQSDLVLRGDDTAYVFTGARLRVGLTGADGTPLAGVQVRLQRRVDGTWRQVQRLTTDEDGRAETRVGVARDDADNVWRARWTGGTVDDIEYAGARSARKRVDGRRIGTTLLLTGPARVVDERGTRLRIRWHADDGRAVHQRVRLYRKRPGQRTWTRVRTPLVRHGDTTLRIRPRVDTRWKVVGAANAWHTRARSSVHRVDNVPPGRRFVLPRAPRPRVRLPAQRRAVGRGLQPDVLRIPDRVWRSMTGRSWHRGCPVGRRSLRLVRMNYWGFDGYRHRGELVVHRRITTPTVRVFRALYRGRFPVRAMYRVDRFGWSRRLHGANDFRSMAADNTSAFNCRGVVGNPRVRSPHSYGGSIDINPWENPYVSRRGVFPNSWWLHRSHPWVAWRSYSHPVVRAFTRNGFSWGGGYSDFHHFQD